MFPYCRELWVFFLFWKFFEVRYCKERLSRGWPLKSIHLRSPIWGYSHRRVIRRCVSEDFHDFFLGLLWKASGKMELGLLFALNLSAAGLVENWYWRQYLEGGGREGVLKEPYKEREDVKSFSIGGWVLCRGQRGFGSDKGNIHEWRPVFAVRDSYVTRVGFLFIKRFSPVEFINNPFPVCGFCYDPRKSIKNSKWSNEKTKKWYVRDALLTSQQDCSQSRLGRILEIVNYYRGCELFWTERKN